MAIESDVLVIGGGLAGLTSALKATREGADVRLVSYKQSSLRHASGLVDLLGYTPDGEGPVTDPYAAMSDLHDAHPYQTVGVETVRESMSLFDEVTDYRGDHTDTNALVPTHGGTVKPTARYPTGAAAGLASDDRDVLLVGIESMVDFDAPHVAAHLEAAGVPFDVRGETIKFPGDLQADAKITRYAKLLDTNGEVAVRGRKKGARDALAERVNTVREKEERVGFPAILGDDHTDAVRAALEDRIGADVFEVPMGPPSLPGLRLEDALFEALDEAGASFETGNPVVDFDADGDRIETVYIEKNGARIPNSADQYVLATGGLVGKGIESNRESVYEPIFDCHVEHGEDRYEWFDGDVFGEHPFASFGVETDSTLRPLTGDDEVQFDNLRAAGSVLGGYDFQAEKSGSGVSIATGYVAGENAAAEAR
ncbi:glycerol-3-phosphate dehydrogenase subunit GlpB [Haloarcula onubensis]|uniref:Glycerol-3-phosphate dehydrogenase subunit GlpB n=1 Tax=Haloarcula onubensis TaxID=2950539 RepID=A0ABU2FV04_9EURY|nr:glycerol-3-phosphate dehydrogenase subunit GlpB [Halomicroarcula sp. S3CR25-11]MDS0284254.1 glycerol-3-phosphate dehydrogenase subunit GlpB [Halomicroarcula sp. S3CR25-11]